MLALVRRFVFVLGESEDRGARKVCVRVVIALEKIGRRTEGGGIVVGLWVRWIGSMCSSARRWRRAEGTAICGSCGRVSVVFVVVAGVVGVVVSKSSQVSSVCFDGLSATALAGFLAKGALGCAGLDRVTVGFASGLDCWSGLAEVCEFVSVSSPSRSTSWLDVSEAEPGGRDAIGLFAGVPSKSPKSSFPSSISPA